MTEVGVEERVAKLALVETKHGLALDQTITARTLAQSSLDSTMADPKSVGSIADLPRITVDTRVPLPSSPRLEAASADLAILSTLGEGGMGRVHLARQRSLGREVALKTVKDDASPGAAHALLVEARITGMLEHPGVIPVHALGVDGEGKPIIVMKRVDGVDLATRLDGHPQRGEGLVSVIEVLVQVCRTLEFAHARGIIHRDVKPENIIVGSFGEVYLLDWGVATTKEDAARDDSGNIVGTPVYMAPEMVAGEAVDERTDVYLLGATLHEALTGRPRHEGKTILEVTKNALVSEPVRYGAEVPDELARLCHRSTARERSDRPQTAREVREALSAFLRHRTAHAFAAAALERVVSIETMLESTTAAPPDLAQAYRWIAEARFGLHQSTREGAAEEIVRDGMRRCMKAAIELELRQDHVESAQALAAELLPADPEIERRIEARRLTMRDREREHERLVELERDLDPTRESPLRTRIMGLLVALSAVSGVTVTVVQPVLTPPITVMAGIAVLAITLGGIVVVRKRLFANAFNRRAAALLVLAIGVMLANRIFGLVIDRAVHETLTIDLFLLAATMFAGSISFFRPLAVPGVVVGGFVVPLRFFPAHDAAVFNLALTFSMTITVVLFARAARQGIMGRTGGAAPIQTRH